MPEPVLPRDFSIRLERQTGEFEAMARTPLHLFSMPTAIPQNPLALDVDDDVLDPNALEASPPDNNRLQVSLGMDNPFFDFRRAGDPGGVGYYKLYSQALLWDSRTTTLSVGLEAMTPAGLDAEGVATGFSAVEQSRLRNSGPLEMRYDSSSMTGSGGRLGSLL